MNVSPVVLAALRAKRGRRGVRLARRQLWREYRDEAEARGGRAYGYKEALPIRLTPMTATCRELPLSRVKLGIGWSRGVARDAEQ